MFSSKFLGFVLGLIKSGRFRMFPSSWFMVIFVSALVTVPVLAQDAGNRSLQLAVNTARMRAEAINGGLSKYRTAGCMYVSGRTPCLVSSGPTGYLFRFLGGAPGWQQLGIQPTVETEVMIDATGRNVMAIYYNGPLR